MAYPVSRLGDTSDHGGTIITASPTFDVDGVHVARIGDILDCPEHGQNPIISSLVTDSLDEGQPLAHVGSKTACGATIVTGCSTFKIE
ncbi:PAAR domain-containing protein [Hydromonas duriensis]|uniref:Putative Zn-binding protein involved in type VI secretion n=1 Tax=Hydromonas duriensis TaxID=1527608 RepID=A0A4R6Y5G8_9BURK|nr:PAAR domain-containing protein [Hydromonas duriensis]TDR30677.1 putative Zn-binding protein involved in type VI secretion [Hydromonas duriensis]